MYFYVFWELIYFYVICIYVIWETTPLNDFDWLIVKLGHSLFIHRRSVLRMNETLN